MKNLKIELGVVEKIWKENMAKKNLIPRCVVAGGVRRRVGKKKKKKRRE